MKSFCLTAAIVVFLLFITNGIQAQSPQTKLNQSELAKQFLGTWQVNTGKDTVQMWEGKLYGEAVITNISMVIKGKKSDSYMACIGYDSRDDKLKGYNLFANTDFATWIGVFTTDKIFKSDLLDTFNPEKVLWKNEFEFKTPTEVVIKGLILRV